MRLSLLLLTATTTLTLALPQGDTPSARGQVTYYHPALGACGQTHGDNDKVAAVAASVFDSQKPCGKSIRVKGGAGSATVKVVDRCVGCAASDLDLSPSAFKEAIGGLGIGRTTAEWEWV